MGQLGSHGEAESSFFFSKYDRGKFYHQCVSVEVKCENQMKQGKSEGFDSCDRPNNLAQI